MSELPQEGPFDQTLDEADELTELEYASTQRQLSPAEQQRLADLHHEAGRIVRAERTKEVEEAPTEGTIVSGDDSP